jgi:hypothetical protein
MFHWATRLDQSGADEAFDLKPGANLSRRRFVALAAFTSVSVVLSRAGIAGAAQGATAGGTGDSLRPPGATTDRLPCAPAETSWYESRGTAVAVDDPALYVKPANG